jgi:hypothetical protein
MSDLRLALPANPALRQGLIFGIVLGIIQEALGLIITYGAPAASLGSTLSLATFLAALLLYGGAGYQAARQTGRTSTGALAGTITGLVCSVFGLVISIIVTLATLDIVRQHTQAEGDRLHMGIHYTNQLIIQGTIFNNLIGIVLSLILGVGLGALGGALGKSRAPRVVEPEQ